MTVMRVQRTQAAKSLQPEDATVNTFYFNSSLDWNAGLLTTICSKIDDLFNLAVGGGNAVRWFMAESTMSANQNSYKVFDMDDPPTRVPIGTPGAQNVTPQILTGPLPSEVACCLSFRGPLISGAAAGRRRGRVFIGPLNTAAIEVDPLTGQARPVAALLTALTAGANRLHDDLLTNLVEWCVYSETARQADLSTGGTGDAASGCTAVTYAWADNAFDTQRRRGQRTTARTAVTV